MGVKKFRPTTPSLRHMTVSDFAEITKKTPEKSLLASKKKNAGRNSYGRITVRHQGGGNRQKYRIIDFKRLKDDMTATVIGIEYDPNRSANIALIEYEDGTKALEMPENYVVEMVSDWWAFSHKSGNLYEIFDWYKKNKKRQILHENTRKLVEEILDKIKTELDKETE